MAATGYTNGIQTCIHYTGTCCWSSIEQTAASSWATHRVTDQWHCGYILHLAVAESSGQLTVNSAGILQRPVQLHLWSMFIGNWDRATGCAGNTAAADGAESVPYDLGESRHQQRAECGAGNKTSVVALPSDILQHIYSFFEDPTDVTSCHMVDTRCAYSLALFPTKCRVAQDAAGHQPHVGLTTMMANVNLFADTMQVLRSSKGGADEREAAAPRLPGVGAATPLSAAPPWHRRPALLQPGRLSCKGRCTVVA